MWTLAALLTLAAAGACAPKPITLPSGDGVPYPDFAQALAEATDSCGNAKAITAELGLSGRVGSTKLRGRAIVGAATPDRIRLEALAPFGPPVFVLASRSGVATLLLPRDDRVLRDAPPEQIVEALTGVSIAPAALRTALTGCGIELDTPASATRYGDRWIAIEGGNGTTLFLEFVNATWRVRGAHTRAFTMTYDELGAIHPVRLTIRALGRLTAEIRLRLSQIEMNPQLAPEAFEVQIPPEATPLTIEELRDAGPLGEKR